MTRGWKIATLTALAISVILVAYYLRAVFLPLLVALLASIAGVYVVLRGVMATLIFWTVPAAFSQATDFVRVTFLGENPKINRLITKAEPMLVRAVGSDKAGEIVKRVHERAAEAE